MNEAESPKLSFLAGILVLCSIGIYGYLYYLNWHFDDAMIIARIVRHLLNGDGWIFNIGESVNASTSVLNTILITAFAAVTGDIPMAAHLVSAISITAASFILWRILTPRHGDAVGIAAGALLSLLLIHSMTWGLEVHLFTALLLYFILLEQRGKNSWFALGLLILARPDAVLVAFFKIVKTALQRQPLLKGLLILSIPLIPWIAFSLYTFGQVFPNSLANKVWQGRSGMWGHGYIYLKALWKHLLELPYPMLAALPLSLLGLSSLLYRRSAMMYLVLFCIVQQGAYCILNVPGYHWYFVLVDTTILILGILGLVRLIEYNSKGFLITLSRPIWVVIFAFFGITACGYAIITRPSPVLNPPDTKYSAATREFENTNPGPGSLAALEVGSIGYAAKRHIIDLTGLTSSNPEYITGKNTDGFFTHPADFILLHSPAWHFERALLDDIRFDLIYEPVLPASDSPHGLMVYKKREGTKEFTEDSVATLIRERFPSTVRIEKAHTQECSGECLCIIDHLNGQFSSVKEIHSKPTLIRARGWAVEPKAPDINSVVSLLLEGESGLYRVPGTRSSRPDVAAHVGRGDFEMAGFSIEGHALDLPPGKYAVLVGQERGETINLCRTTITLILE